MIVAEEDTSATIFLIFFHNHPVKSIDFLSLCEKTNLFSFLFLNGKEFCEMGFARKDVEATKKMEKKFVRYPEGAEKYSLGLTKFQALAKEAKAVYKIDKVALVNCEIFENCASHSRYFSDELDAQNFYQKGNKCLSYSYAYGILFL